MRDQSRMCARKPLAFARSGSKLRLVASIAFALAISATARSAESTPPVLAAIEPSLGPAGAAYPVHVTLRGSGFFQTGNIVRFGPVMIPGRPSPDGTTIMLDIPKLVPSRGEVPPMVLSAGDYPVSVTTPAGTSNLLMFKLTPNP